MAKRVKIRLTLNGCAEIRCGGGCRAYLEGIAQDAAARLGEGYSYTVKVYGGPSVDGHHARAVAKVKADWNQTRARGCNEILKAVLAQRR